MALIRRQKRLRLGPAPKHPPRRTCAFELLEDRRLLAADNWIGTASGNWNTAADWSAGVPTSTSAVTINTANTQTISITSGTIAVQSLTIDGNDSLSISGGSLTTSA